MRETVILGGGVIGAAAAYYLSLRGISATVVERRQVASGASGTAAGLLSAPTPADLREPWGELARTSLALHYEVATALNGPRAYDFEPVDMALVATNATERQYLIDGFGEGAWLDSETIALRCPWLDPGSVAGGVSRSGCAQLDPARFTSTLLEAAGAEVLIASAEGVSAPSGQVAGVTIDGRVHPCATAIVAMGPWSADVSRWLGCAMPVRPLKGQILRMQVPEAPNGGFADLEGNYVVRKPNGLTYTGTTEEDAGFDEQPTSEVERQILATNGAYAPALMAGRVVERTACLRPLSADNSPIIGAVPGIDGAFVATGHGRKGILMSLGTGKALAELIIDGVAETVDLRPFAPGRFAGERGGAGT